MKKFLLSLSLGAASVLGLSAQTTYELTPITDLVSGDKVIIVDQTSSNALPNAQATTKGSVIVAAVTLNADKSQVTSSADGLLFTVTVTADGYKFTSAANDANDLYCISDNNGVRVASTTSNNIFSWDAANNKLKNIGQSRYLGVYNNQDWRCYASATQANIKATVTAFYKEVTAVSETKVTTPKADAGSGTYINSVTVTLTCATPDAEISYTIGNETKVYTEPFTISESCTVKASATKEGMEPSDELVLDYVIAHVEGQGTETDPYTTADALKLIAAGRTDEMVCVKGIVCHVEEISTQYGNATYNISDNGANENFLTIFRGLDINSVKFTSTDAIQVGDNVVVKGSLINYNNTPELAQGNYLISLQRGDTKLHQDPELAFSESQIRIPLKSEDYVAPALTYAEGFDPSLVTWESSNENVAIHDASGLIVDTDNVGTATITASFAGNDEWLAATASYTITVYDPNAVVVYYNDILDKDKFQTSGSYEKKDWTSTQTGVTYLAKAMLQNNAMQINTAATSTGANSGIISTANPKGLDIDKITVTTVDAATNLRTSFAATPWALEGDGKATKVVEPKTVTITDLEPADEGNNTYTFTPAENCPYFFLHTKGSGAVKVLSVNVSYKEISVGIKSVEAVDSNSAAAEWFDLQGRRVAAPAKGGVYILKQGSLTTKRAF